MLEFGGRKMRFTSDRDQPNDRLKTELGNFFLDPLYGLLLAAGQFFFIFFVVLLLWFGNVTGKNRPEEITDEKNRFFGQDF